MLGLPRITTSYIFTIPNKPNRIPTSIFRKCCRPKFNAVTKRTLATIKPSPINIPKSSNRGGMSTGAKGMSAVAVLGAIGMGGYYLYTKDDKDRFNNIWNKLNSLISKVNVVEDNNKLSVNIPKTKEETPSTQIKVVKSDKIKVKENTEKPTHLSQDRRKENDTTDLTGVIDKQSPPSVLGDKEPEKIPELDKEKAVELVAIENKKVAEQEIEQVIPTVKEDTIKTTQEPYDTSSLLGKIPEISKQARAAAKPEETADSEYPFVQKNIEKDSTNIEKLKSKALTSFQHFKDGKDKLIGNIQSQTLERQRLLENPDNSLSKESLESLESVQSELQTDYNTAKLYALNVMKELREIEDGTAAEYENKISSVDLMLSNQLMKLKSDNLVSTESSDSLKILKLTAEIESLRNKLSQMKIESLEKQDEVEKRYNESLNSLEGETKKLMYQLIETHHDHMATHLTEHTDDLNKHWEKFIEEWTIAESQKYQKEKSIILSRLKGISAGIDRSEEFVTEMKQFHLVLSLVNELREFIDKKEHSNPHKIFVKQRIDKLCEHLHGQPDLIALLRQIPSGVLAHGLVSRPCILERFRGIERSCSRLAYVDDEEKLFSYVKSYFRSLVTLTRDSSVDNLQSVQSNSAMIRSAYACVQKGDLYTATVLMNNLRGAARSEASNWVRDTVSYLETEQVICILYWHLVASIVAATK
ncbi:MICOS complex subunit MIC60-like isoform X3 [Oopsacas minuta]|uniref:MICOS complex subunit MIC60 n=1 Tax=Oopsacas minuta TaxID=111878 RepID=A0AAV7KA50_9METZ|nr:MICOS complex subunit MIC60-like isoform X3 [Oopsacas minuta]